MADYNQTTVSSRTETISVDFAQQMGRIRPMHGVNSGPFRTGTGLGTTETFREAGFPLVRNHDSSASLFYFGERSNDVDFIFRDFDADENDPASYDFHYTDRFVRDTFAAGASLLFRLGTKIEGGDLKYNIRPPKDYAKYARICEHIIAHYCRGWADGMTLPIQYWEIWNEPENKNCWTGTFEEFLDFYAVMARHLKSCYPELKIGGPGFTRCRVDVDRDYPNEFLRYMKENNLPCDFFSWHVYGDNVEKVERSVSYARELLTRWGYEKAELVLDEWNYIRGWRGEDIKDSYRIMATEEGAAFDAAVLLAGQKAGLDQLMYYDIRPDCSFNGLFAPYVFTPLKGYYAFRQFNRLYQLGQEVFSDAGAGDIRVCAARNGDEGAVQLAYVGTEQTEIRFALKNLPEGKTVTCYLIDREHTDDRLWAIEGTAKEMAVNLTLAPSSVVLLTIS